MFFCFWFICCIFAQQIRLKDMKRLLLSIMCVTIATMAVAQTKIDAACRAKYAKMYFTDTLGTVLPFRLLTPQKADGDTANRKYPVILFLHGAGERESLLVRGVGDGMARLARVAAAAGRVVVD